MSPDTFHPCSEAFWCPRQWSCSDMTTVTTGQCCHRHCPRPRVSSIGARAGTTGRTLPEFWWSCDEERSPAGHQTPDRGHLTCTLRCWVTWQLGRLVMTHLNGKQTWKLQKYSSVVLFSVYIASGRYGLLGSGVQIVENFCHLNSHFISPTAFMNNKQHWLIDIHWIIYPNKSKISNNSDLYFTLYVTVHI